MKTLFILLLAFSIFSCNKNDDDGENQPETARSSNITVNNGDGTQTEYRI